MRKLLTILYVVIAIEVFVITSSAVIGQFQHKPILGVQVDGAHPHGDFVAAWFFLEGTGNKVFDLSGNNHTGTFNGDPQWVSGKFGQAIDFDGTGDYIVITDFMNIIPTSEITVVVWIYIESGTDNALFRDQTASSTNRISAHVPANDGKIYWDFGDSTGTGRLSYTPSGGFQFDVWQHFVFVSSSSGGYQRIYRNGILEASDGTASTLTQYSGDLDISTRASGLNRELTGKIDNFLIYNRALTAREIVLLYREPFGMFVKDDIAILATAAIPPPAPTGQVITIIMTSIPLFLIPFFFIKRRKLCR